MHRATPSHTAFRAYSAGGARSVGTAVDDSKLMQESAGNFMKNESRKGIETPQNYGFTSVPMGPDKDKDGNITGSYENFIGFVGGSRAFPYVSMRDDRRHRLLGLQPGDVALYRTKTDGMQLHMNKDGAFWTGPNDKSLRLQLIQPQQQQQQPQQQDSASAGQSSQQDQQSNKPTGQKALYQQQSTAHVHMTDANTEYLAKQHKLVLGDNATGIDINPDNNVYLGALQGKGSFLGVMLADGSVAKNVFGLRSGGAADEVEVQPSPLLEMVQELIKRVEALEAACA
jgi:phage gp45-like